MAKKKAEEKALNLDQILFNCRDYLRAARNSGSFFEKRDMMLPLGPDCIVTNRPDRVREWVNAEMRK